MKSQILIAATISVFSLSQPKLAFALDGDPWIHDPSTVVPCDGKYYTYGTGGSGLVSDDGWTWHSGARLPIGGAAPDVIHIGDRYFMAIAVTGGGLGGGHAGGVRVMWSKSLDTNSPDYGFKDNTVVATSDGAEDCDAIDPSFLLDPNGRLWLTYGTFFGFIRLVELDPKTGHRIEGNQFVNIAIDNEATDLIYRDGWYYLLGDHGTCCSGANSTYNIVVGRSREVAGPYLDNMGVDMLKGGGKMVVAASGRHIGPGHFGRMVLENGVEKFSCHYEADLDKGARSVLDIRPLLWIDGWPVGGDNFQDGTYEIQSQRSGFALELAVDSVSMSGRGGFGGFGRAPSGPVTSIPLPDVAKVSTNWPTGDIGLRIGDYMLRPHQKWAITTVTNAGGYLGSPYFKITIADTDRALVATEGGELITVPTFTGAPEQLWQIDELTDGSYRIMPKSAPGASERLVLTAVGGSTPTLAKFDPKSDKSRWNFRAP
jgi:arabinan endo-1,5-alpha-L-arabinosidase